MAHDLKPGRIEAQKPGAEGRLVFVGAYFGIATN
jgi:hypothetical protein